MSTALTSRALQARTTPHALGLHASIRTTVVFSLALVAAMLVAASAPAEARNVVVVPRDYPTIQAAVTAAAPGDTIRVAAGTFTEQVVIDKDLTLIGAGVDATVVRAPTTLTPFAVDLPTGHPESAIVRIGHGAQVRMSGFTVAGPTPCGPVSGVVALQGADLQLSDSRVSGLRPDPATCPASQASTHSIVFGLPPRIQADGQRGSTASGRVTHVMVDHYQSVGINVSGPLGGPPSRVTVADNLVTGGAELATEQLGIVVEAGAVARVTGNTVSGGVCTIPGCGSDPISQFQSMGILVAVAPTGTTVADNHISGNDVGIYQIASPDCCTISENSLDHNRFFGIVIQDGDGTTSQNSITGGQIGIGVVADATDTEAVSRGDHITGTTVAPVREIQCCGFAATAIVKNS
jgi:parallel beta-helix repeat protein